MRWKPIPPPHWKALLDMTGNRARYGRFGSAPLLHSPVFQSTRTTRPSPKAEATYLLENGGERLRKLLLAMGTIEVLPNPLFLNEEAGPRSRTG